MSLTSYRAAPSRGERRGVREERFERVPPSSRPKADRARIVFVIFGCPPCRPGGDLLSRALRRSTIGSGGLNDRVRNGIGWGTSDIATRSTRGTADDEKTLSAIVLV